MWVGYLWHCEVWDGGLVAKGGKEKAEEDSMRE